MSKSLSEDNQFRVLRLLEQEPQLSQRQLSDELGVSLGAINYCLKALVAKGHVKVRNFRASNNKLRYSYILTPSGLRAKSRLAGAFLKRKLAEYEALEEEIRVLQREGGQG